MYNDAERRKAGQVANKIFYKITQTKDLVLKGGYFMVGFFSGKIRAKCAIAAITLVLTLVFSMSGQATAEVREDTSSLDFDLSTNIATSTGLLYNSGAKWPSCNQSLCECPDNYANYNEGLVYASGDPTVPINEEKFSLVATDSTGEEIKLNPHNDWDLHTEELNANANGAASVTYKIIGDFSSNCERTNDSRKLKELTSPLYINSNEIVGNGQVLYRTATGIGATYSGWIHKKLNRFDIMSFPAGRFVQIVIIYEIKDTSGSSNVYYNMKGIYTFRTVA